MLIFPDMIAEAAKNAGMKVPENPDEEDSWDEKDYPHFTIFCNLQLCRRMSDLSQHWENAKVIAKIPEKDLHTLTMSELLELGFTL